MLVSVPLRGFWYSDLRPLFDFESVFDVSVPLRGFGYLNSKSTKAVLFQTSFSPFTGIWVLRPPYPEMKWKSEGSFQSPYGDFGTTTLCLPVSAPSLGPQAIFSNLRLFSPFGVTRVKNKNQAVSFIRLVIPLFTILKIFKPRRFLTLKSVFFDSPMTLTFL